MSGFFARLARRALGEAEGVQPRMPLRFEAEGAIAVPEPPPFDSWTGRVPAGTSREASGVRRPAPRPLIEAPTRGTGRREDGWDAATERPREMPGVGRREPASEPGQPPSGPSASPPTSSDAVTGPNVAAGEPRADRSSGHAPPTVSRPPPAADSRTSAALAIASDDQTMADRPPRADEGAEVRQRAAAPMAPAARDALLDRAAAEPPLRAPAEQPSVHVTIGTIEVRATIEPPKRVVPPRGPAKPRVPLDEYLRRRGGAAQR